MVEPGKKAGKKAQVSVEYLFTTGIALGILVIILIIALNMGNDSIRVAQAKDSVDTLGKAADYVHSLGPGAKETVRVYFPNGMQFIDVSEDRLLMRISLSSGDSDVFATANAKLIGSIKLLPGAQDVLVTALPDGRVLFGSSGLACNPSFISMSLQQNEAAYSQVNVSNLLDYDITDATYSLAGTVAAITDFNPPGSVIPAANPVFATLNFNPDLNAPIGTYSGLFRATAGNGSECSTAITIFITRTGGDDTEGPLVAANYYSSPDPPTTSTPITINATADDTTTGGSTISLCELAIDNPLMFWPNPMAATDGNYSDEVAENAGRNIGALSAATHTIYVRCFDSYGNVGYGAPLTIIVTGTGGASDTQGPVVRITEPPSGDVIYPSPQWVNANATDAQSNIAGCRMNLSSNDGLWSSGWLAMNATDGSYNSLSENASFNNGSFLLPSLGAYTLNVSCNDTAGNSNYSTRTFTVRYPYSGDILFLLKNSDGTLSESETNWIDWINNNYTSAIGSFSMNVTFASDLTAYIPYKTVIIADDLGTNSTIAGYLNNYKDGIPGNYILLFGGGLQYQDKLTGVSANSPGEVSRNDIRIIDSSTFITNGYSDFTVISNDIQNIRYTQQPNGPNILSLALACSGPPCNNYQQVAMLQGANVVTFGATRPDFFNDNGNTLATRIINYALNNSN